MDEGLKLRVRELEVYCSYLDDLGKHYFLDEQDLEEIETLVKRGSELIREACMIAHQVIEGQRQRREKG